MILCALGLIERVNCHLLLQKQKLSTRSKRRRKLNRQQCIRTDCSVVELLPSPFLHKIYTRISGEQINQDHNRSAALCRWTRSISALCCAAQRRLSTLFDVAGLNWLAWRPHAGSPAGPVMVVRVHPVSWFIFLSGNSKKKNIWLANFFVLRAFVCLFFSFCFIPVFRFLFLFLFFCFAFFSVFHSFPFFHL